MQDQAELKQLFLERTLVELELARDWILRLGRSTAQENLVINAVFPAAGPPNMTCQLFCPATAAVRHCHGA